MSFNDECGVFGIYNHPDSARMAYLGLYALQHRGQESAGIVSVEDGRHHHHKGLGLVGDVFKESDLSRLKGPCAIGHVRYSTTGDNILTNAQPITAQLLNGPVAYAHNGNIVNSTEVRKGLKKDGAIFQGTTDTECLMHMIARHPSKNFVRALEDSFVQLDGASSMVAITHSKLVAVRDPYGFRPLVLGRLETESGTSTVLASESCAFDLIGAKLIREIAPGEIFWVDEDGEHSQMMDIKRPKTSQCVFEHIYFARPDSIVFGKSVYGARKRMGEALAGENSVEADMVLPVPDSGVPAAIGYSHKSGIPFELGIIRNHYIGRTFIQPHQSIRNFSVKIKLNPQSAILKDKRVIVIDDSLVRGTTSKKVISLIRQAGAKEVHVRIACPPTTGPCLYGVDTPQKKELIASHQSVQQICEYIQADTLGYLSMEGLWQAVGENSNYCAACFDGEYPTPLYDNKLS